MQKTAFVTGGARRIGRAIVEDLAGHGWAVAIHCNRSFDDATRLADGVRTAGGRAAVVRGDLADLAALPRLVEDAAAALGPIHLLVNNASEFVTDAFGSLEPGTWNRQISVNLTAPVLLSQAFVAALPANGTGVIINITDQRVWKPVPDYFSYQVSKSALWSVTQTMAQALAPRVRVNAIAPGPSFPGPRQSAADFQHQIDTVPLRAGPAPAEFGRAVRFFVDMPSVTGQMLALDGGQHLAWLTPDVTGIAE